MTKAVTTNRARGAGTVGVGQATDRRAGAPGVGQAGDGEHGLLSTWAQMVW